MAGILLVETRQLAFCCDRARFAVDGLTPSVGPADDEAC
jgi:hypothetical protein